MKNANRICIVAGFLSLCALMMPWLETTTMQIGDFSMTAVTQQTNGILTWWGLSAALITLAGIWLAWKRNRWTFLSGLFNGLVGLAFMLGWLGQPETGSMGVFEGLSEAGTSEIKTGIYFFLSSALLFLIFSTFLFPRSEKKDA